MDFHEINIQGKFWIERIDDISLIGHTADDESRLVYSKSDERVYIGTSTEWRVLAIEYSVMSKGTKMLFGSYPLPTGWNITTTLSDLMVLITITGSSIGSFSGSWTITGMQNSDAHDHGGWTGIGDQAANVRKYDVHRVTRPDGSHKHSILPDGIHSHPLINSLWRPEYIKFSEGTLQ